MTFEEFKTAVIAAAKACGLEEYELYYMEDSSQSVTAFQGDIDEFSSEVASGASFRCKVNGKMGYCSTEDFSEEEAVRIVGKAAQNAAIIESADESVIFAGSPAYETIEEEETPLSSMSEMSKLALGLYEAALRQDEKVQKNSTASVSQGTTMIRLVNSAGLDLSSKSTM